MSKLTIATVVHNNKGKALDKFFWAVNRYGRTHKVLVVLAKDHGVEDPEKLRGKYKSLDIQYCYTQVEPSLDRLIQVAANELDLNKSIYLDLEKPAL